MTRAFEPGYARIGRLCSAKRRSLWLRINQEPGAAPHSLELCAGREGDDDYVLITRDNPQYHELYEVLATARWVAEDEPVRVEHDLDDEATAVLFTVSEWTYDDDHRACIRCATSVSCDRSELEPTPLCNLCAQWLVMEIANKVRRPT